MKRGYVKLWRKIEDSGLLQAPKTFALFMYILLNSSHKARKTGTPNGVIQIERGQYISGRIALATALKQSEQEIRTSLKRLEILKILTIKSTNKYSIYTIENYSKYQDKEIETTNSTTNKQPTDNQQITTKQECNNLINNIHPDFVSQNLWNDFLEIRKSLKAKNTEPAIRALIAELTKLRDAGHDPVEVINQSIRSSWKGLFPVSDKGKKSVAKGLAL